MKRAGITGEWGSAARNSVAGVLLAWMLITTACATKPQKLVSAEGNPWFHYTQGMEALDKNDRVLALEKFDRALEQDRAFAPAFAGKALASAMSVKKQASKEPSRTDVRNARRLLGAAEDEAETQEQAFIYQVTAMRVYTALKSRKWLSRVEDHYQDAQTMRKLDEEKLPYYQNKNSASYFMGVAYYEGYKFRQAEELLVKASAARAQGKWQSMVTSLHNKVQRIIRASADFTLGDIAAKIAVKDEITRADVAALIVSELKLNRSSNGGVPFQSERVVEKPLVTPVDVEDHPFQNQIETAIKWDIRSLAATYDAPTRVWLFRPDEGVSRKQLAQVFEDLLIKLLDDESMASSLIGSDESPYLDVPTQAAWFNAVSTVTSRGLMEPDLSGEFRPDDPADGAQLLLGVLKLRYVVYTQ